MGEIAMEDGRNRCPYNPEYKSTAIMAGMYSLIHQSFTYVVWKHLFVVTFTV